MQILGNPALKWFLKPSLDWLLVFVPISATLRIWPKLGNETALFICSCLAVVPLAGWMGRATEELAEHLGQGIGGLLNATFGNAAELIIALMALSKGLTGVVKASITGSIIGNILLVMGASILGGGLKFSEQRFNKTAARASATYADARIRCADHSHGLSCERRRTLRRVELRRQNKSCRSPSRSFFSPPTPACSASS